MKKVLMLLADGFETFEASVFIDVIGRNLVEGDKSTELFTCGSEHLNQIIRLLHLFVFLNYFNTFSANVGGKHDTCDCENICTCKKFVYLQLKDIKLKAMNTKLTLTIEESIIEKAKKYANAKGKSLSSIIENYLRAITKEETAIDVELTPIVKSLKGSFRAPKNFNYKKELSKRLIEKYL